MGLKDNIMTSMAEASQISALLDRGCEFEGKLTFEGTVRVNGIFSGEIFSNDVLVVGDTAVVNAEIDVDTIIVSGEVNGNITARTRIEVHQPGILRGNICTPNLVIDEGVIFEGSCRMPAREGESVNLGPKAVRTDEDSLAVTGSKKAKSA